MKLTSLALASLTLALLLAACGDTEKKKAPAAPPSAGGYAAGAGGYGYAAQLGDDLDKKAGDAVKKARAFVLTMRDEESGAFGKGTPIETGFSAFGALALVASTPRKDVATDPLIEKTLAHVAAGQKPNGSIWSNGAYVNYETSVSVSAFAMARNSKFKDAQAKGREFLVQSQVAGDEKSLDYGGFPYKDEEPNQPLDLSNAQMAADALHDAALPADHVVWKRLLTYTSRVQNRSETNTVDVKRTEDGAEVEVVSGNDGGAAYAPGVSKAGLSKRSDGKFEPRSYGSMTYALLKCDLFAGLKPGDPRFDSAWGWITRHFTVDRNPGFEQNENPAKAGMQGYYYYLFTMSRALAELERATGKAASVADADGKAHDWRRELVAKLVSLQKPNGSWANDIERWEEANPLLATAYAMQALAYCQGRLP